MNKVSFSIYSIVHVRRSNGIIHVFCIDVYVNLIYKEGHSIPVRLQVG